MTTRGQGRSAAAAREARKARAPARHHRERDRVHRFYDGELGPAEAARFRDHLAGCPQCQAELDELLALELVADTLRGR